MKAFIAINFTAYDNSLTPKGEEFDEELRSQVEGIEIDGYEIADCDISRSKADIEKKDEGVLERLVEYSALDLVKHLATKGDADPAFLSEVSPINDKFTNGQMLSFNALRFIELVESTLKRKVEVAAAKDAVAKKRAALRKK
jgi:hypothetical protein